MMPERQESTSAEVGQMLKIGYQGRWVAARRLPELAPEFVKRGAQRLCTVNNTKAITWWPQ